MSDVQPGLQIFNTLSGQLEPFVPLDADAAAQENRPARVKLYVCGPTVYDDAHLGHARCYITWDVLYRFLQFLGYDVQYVRNVTDVDDKILNRAQQLGLTPAEVARQNYESFTADMAALNVQRPTDEPKATAYIATMIEVIQGLLEKGAAYVTPDGTVYFRVAADANYGQLSKKPLDDLKSGARVDVDPHKENPLDFALWKSVPAEERTDDKLAQGYCFESPWGRGRPGWHIECSAMNYALLGPQIDIHAGGADLIFPHHENEIAQTETWRNLAGGHDHPEARFSKYWMHNGFVNVSGEKMSKSLGNFSTIKKLLERYDANTIRYFLLTNHYRMPVDFNDEALQAAENWVRKISKYLTEAKSQLQLDVAQIQGLVLTTFQSIKIAGKAESQDDYCFHMALDLREDLNTPKALAKLNEALNRMRFLSLNPTEANGNSAPGNLTFLFQSVISMMALLGFDLAGFFASVEVQLPAEKVQEIAQLIAERKQAKSEKNWTKADAIRDQLKAEGIQILDNKDGTTSVEKDGCEIVRV